MEGLIFALVGVFVGFLLASGKDYLDRRRKRQAMATALLAEVSITENLAHNAVSDAGTSAQLANLRLPLHMQLGTCVDYLSCKLYDCTHSVLYPTRHYPACIKVMHLPISFSSPDVKLMGAEDIDNIARLGQLIATAKQCLRQDIKG